MDTIVLKGKPRANLGTRHCRNLRAQGLVPANLYGHAQANVSFMVEEKEIAKLVKEGHHMLTLDIDGMRESGLLKEIQFDTYGDHIVHLDFARISLDEVVEVLIPVETVGVAKGVSSGGVLDIPRHEIALRGKARLIPEHIRLDVSHLGINDAIRVSDLVLPSGVEVMLAREDVVVILHAPRVEAPAAETPTEPQLIEKKKPE
ncbi:MAG: 50S ribosomal protein L25 [Planctomycetota bacterium]